MNPTWYGYSAMSKKEGAVWRRFCGLVLIELCFDVLWYWLLILDWLRYLPFPIQKSGTLFYSADVSFWLHGCCGKWEGWALINRFEHTNWVTVFTPKSVRNSFIFEVFGDLFLIVVTLLFGFFCGCWGFHHWTQSKFFPLFW